MKRNVYAVLTAAALAACLAGGAHAKLPVPTEEQKAAAAAAKEKTAWSDKVSAYQLCRAQDRVVAYYAKTKAADAKPVTPSATSACTDPGPYVAQVAAQAQVGVADSKPVPAAGAVQPGPVPKK